MKEILYVISMITLLMTFACKKGYTLEESKQIQFVKDLILEINSNVDQQRALLELIKTEKDSTTVIQRKIQLNNVIDEYGLLKKQIEKEMDILSTADIEYEFDKIEPSHKKIEFPFK
jgi:hypothetical protein